MTLAFACSILGLPSSAKAQTDGPAAGSALPHYQLAPAFDTSSLDTAVSPCNDFYKFACGKYAANHPIPGDQTDVDQFYTLFNVNTERLQGILTRYADQTSGRTPNQQKIGDDYAACMNTSVIDKAGLTPVQSLLEQIDRVTKPGLPYFAGEMQRYGVGVFFSYSEMQDFKDSNKQIAVIMQGGLGLPERDYYTRAGDKDKALREQYVQHIAKILTLAGEPAPRAAGEARDILAFETTLAAASLTNTEMRDPAAIYHPEALSTFESSLGGLPFGGFFEAIHSPSITSLNDATPKFFPALIEAIKAEKIEVLRAYLRYHLLTRYASVLPQAIDAENFRFYGTELEGQPQQQPRWKRCSQVVDSGLGEALGQVYVQQYFAGDDKTKTLQIVHDIEAAMDRDIDTLQWMSAPTKVRAKEKLHAITDKIGYPEHWRDYSALSISPTDAFGDRERAIAFENDRELAKIGKPIDRLEWEMTPPTINAYYDPSMNNINFPAGILQPAFYDPHADLAVNYGHIGGVVGHELTHGFDDEGSQFNAQGNLDNWWTPEDKKNFEARTSCLSKEYSNFIAVDEVHVNGKLTLGENTADNGGLLLAYMAYLERAKRDGLDVNAKVDGYTGPQRFYIAWAQNWCENTRPETVRERTLTDPHSPDHFRANGPVVNQPGFAGAFGCKVDSPMVPAQNCRIW
ncbi:MAG: M13 family metallopeptidase [Janthinobacterium lividum]